MKKVFLLMVVLALLVMAGFAQAPDSGSNAGPDSVKGCLGGSDGNYTVAEDGTDQIFKIATSTVDLKSHLGHDVKLTGRKAGGIAGSSAADNSFTVAELNMISEHCGAATAAAAGSAATVSPSSETVSPPPADATVPAATAPAPASSATAGTSAMDASVPVETVNPSAATPSTPTATVSPSSAAASTPAADASATAAAVNPSTATVSTPTANVAHATRLSAHPGTPSRQAVADPPPAAPVSPSSEAVIPSAADAATPAANASPSSDTISPPVAAAPAPTVTHKGWPLWLLISGVALVIALGTLVPVLGRWRKQKMLEQTGTENLSFTNETSSDQDKPQPSKVA